MNNSIIRIVILCFFVILFKGNTVFCQSHIMFDNSESIILDGAIDPPLENYMRESINHAKLTKSITPNSRVYKYSKSMEYKKRGAEEEWQLNCVSFYDYDNEGNLLKKVQEDDYYNFDNNYSLYFYDELNRNVRIEHYYKDDFSDSIRMQSYQLIEYLEDFPYFESSIITYSREHHEWDYNANDWKYVWEIVYGEKRNITLSKKVENHLENNIVYRYDNMTGQWEVEGYRYDYVVNPKGLVIEEYVYRATTESEEKWPLILHIKNLINDNGVVFRSDRINYKDTIPYIERWSNIQWDRHDGSMPVSGYAVRGTNRMKSAKIEYFLVSNPNTEYIPHRTFSSEYQNNDSFHYTISDNEGNTLIDNSYLNVTNSSIQEIWEGDNYQMQYYEFDDRNNITHDHYVRKQFYEGNNVITQRDWHIYNYNEYYWDSNEITLSEHYEYDALSETEPYGRYRTIYSDFNEYSSDINCIHLDDNNQPPVYYNLQGMVVGNPQSGQLLIRKVGNKTEKIVCK